MKKEPLVSIITPVYNVEKYLEECIDSLITQSYKNIEIILVNDGSTDQSGCLCDQLSSQDGRIKVLHQKNTGTNYSRCNGFKKSKGEYIAFVDADDIVASNYIETHLKMLNKTDADISVGKTHSFYGESLSQNEIDQCQVKSNTIDFTLWNDKKTILSAFITTLPPYSNMALMCMWSKLYRRSILEDINWEIANYKHGEDYFINAQTYDKARSVCYINDYCYYYRRTREEKLTLNAKDNISPKGEIISNFEYITSLLNMYKDLSKENGINLSKEITISQCRLYTYWLNKLIDMNILTSDIWDKYIIKNLLPLVPTITSSSFAKYMRNNLVYGEKLHKELIQKLDEISKNPDIEKFLQYKMSVLKEQASKPQVYVDYSKAWIVMDRPDSATDSGYHFYKWVKKNKPNTNIYYVINRDSKDVTKLKAEGFNLVFTNTKHHIELLNKCIVEVYPYYTFNLCPQRSQYNSLKVYIGHGIKLNNSLNPGLSPNDYFVTTFKREFDFFKKSHKDFTTIQTGLPRYENLIRTENKEKTNIVIAPQWRRWLNKKASKNSNYFMKWSEFLKAKELKTLSSKNNVIFMIHPELESKIDLLEIPKYINKTKYDDLGAMKIQELMKQTRLLITDFSSVAIDYAIAGANIIYFQFDRDDYYNNHTTKKGWFNYDSDGLGPVFFDANDLKEYLDNLDKGQEMNTKLYQKRLTSLIGDDLDMLQNPSKNIYEIITKTLNKRNIK